MMDRVFVKNLCVHGYHGLIAAEKSLGQKLYMDIDCAVALRPDHADSMAETVNYSELCDLAHDISGSASFNLIETLGERIAARILSQYDMVQSVRVEIRKPSAPIRHSLDYVGVEIVRERK